MAMTFDPCGDLAANRLDSAALGRLPANPTITVEACDETWARFTATGVDGLQQRALGRYDGLQWALVEALPSPSCAAAMTELGVPAVMLLAADWGCATTTIAAAPATTAAPTTAPTTTPPTTKAPAVTAPPTTAPPATAPPTTARPATTLPPTTAARYEGYCRSGDHTVVESDDGSVALCGHGTDLYMILYDDSFGEEYYVEWMCEEEYGVYYGEDSFGFGFDLYVTQWSGTLYLDTYGTNEVHRFTPSYRSNTTGYLC
jgi:predicted lipoprotein with Yx(FWY)xxD motif